MTDDPYRPKGRFQKGHPGFNTPRTPTPPPTDAETDFDAAILNAAQSFGRPGGKAKIGLAGYCNNLMQTRPQAFALLVAKAQTRLALAQQSAAAAIPITIEFTTCPANFFLPYEEARSLWAARTGERPVLVIDNSPDTPPSDDEPDTDDTFDADPDDAG